MALARNISSRHAAVYYEQDDYYTADQSPSEWHGNGARSLQLEGRVDREIFRQLVDGQIPNGPTLHRGGGARRGGTDFEFSAPKSFSIQALVNGDARLIEVHRAAVAAARERIEETIATRVTKDGNTELEYTHSSVIAQFEHATSRAGDPDLHGHVVVLNVTQRADGQWRSIENAEMFKEQRLMYEIYLSQLAKGARDLGYDIALGKHGNPELAHINRAQIEHFSQRAREVDAALNARGLTRETSTAEVKRGIALATRDAKQHYDQVALRAHLKERGSAIGLEAFIPSIDKLNTRALQVESTAAKRAVTFAVEHLSEREAVFSRRDLIVHALRASRSDATYSALTSEIERRVQNKELIQDATTQRLTTQAAIELEHRLLTIEKAGRGVLSPIIKCVDPSIRSGDRELNAGQRSLVELMVTTGNRIVGVNGLAGTGKTTALNAGRSIAEQEGYSVIGLAPSHSAVRALEGAGIEAQTVQRWLLDRTAVDRLNSKSIVIVDEAGLLGTRNLVAVLERIERSAARAVLVGDIYQYESVEAGRGFAQLQSNGMQTVKLTEMIRQQTKELAEAARLSVTSPSKALARLPVVELAEDSARYERIAKDYASLSAEDRTKTMVLTGTHRARHEINGRIRAELKLTGAGQEVMVFRGIDVSAAEKKHVSTYQSGMAIRFEKNYRSLGVNRGDIVRVERIVGSAIIVALPDSTKRALIPERLNGKGWSIGTIESRELTVGDHVRFTGTNPSEHYKNGERGIVRSLVDDYAVIQRTDGSTLILSKGKPQSLDYRYAITGHSAQGLDAERIVMEKDAHSRTTSHRSFYTDLTRARIDAKVFTDNRRSLARAVESNHQKSAALDIASGGVLRTHGYQHD